MLNLSCGSSHLGYTIDTKKYYFVRDHSCTVCVLSNFWFLRKNIYSFCHMVLCYLGFSIDAVSVDFLDGHIRNIHTKKKNDSITHAVLGRKIFFNWSKSESIIGPTSNPEFLNKTKIIYYFENYPGNISTKFGINLFGFRIFWWRTRQVISEEKRLKCEKLTDAKWWHTLTWPFGLCELIKKGKI